MDRCSQVIKQFAVDLVTFTEEILNGKLHFLCSAWLYFPPSLTLNTPFPLYLSKPLTSADVFLHPFPLTSTTMLLSMTKVDETDVCLHAFKYRKMKKGMWY